MSRSEEFRVDDQWGDHSACGPEASQWTAGREVTDGFAFHPTALGHQEMTTSISKALKG